MKNFIFTAFLTVIVSVAYTAIAFLLPQQPEYPAPEVELGSSISPEKLAEAGAQVFEKCSQCHKVGEATRAPDLSGMGMKAVSRAEERGPDFTDVDYLIESICDPNAYIVEPFGRGGMTAMQSQLSGGQILAVTAYLQSLGGEATVTAKDIKPLERFGCLTGGSAAAAGGGEKKAAAPVSSAEDIYNNFGCASCHSIADDSKKSGPSLYDIGKRLTKGEIYESILSPDKVIAKGYSAGLMQKSLADPSNGFYDQMTPADYQALVDWLAAHKGEEE